MIETWLPNVGLGSGWAAFLVVCLLFPMGLAYSRRQVNDIIHDRDEWRSESRIKDAQIAEKDTQLRHLADVGELQKLILEALRRNAQQHQSEETT